MLLKKQCGSNPVCSESLGMMHENWRNKEMVMEGKKEERKIIGYNWNDHLGRF